MNKIKVSVLIGGISRNSLNKKLYGEIIKHNTTNLTFEICEISELPFYSQDLEAMMPQSVIDFKNNISGTDAVLLITPEYNRSIPGVLKNALDWGSRPSKSSCWESKPAAIAGASIGSIGTFGAQQHLRSVCSFLNMNTMNQPEFYFNASAAMDENGLTENTIPFVRNFLIKFEEWIKNHKK